MQDYLFVGWLELMCGKRSSALSFEAPDDGHRHCVSTDFIE